MLSRRNFIACIAAMPALTATAASASATAALCYNPRCGAAMGHQHSTITVAQMAPFSHSNTPPAVIEGYRVKT